MQPSRKKTNSTKEEVSYHGVLVDVYGVGVLLVGASGVGKSEAALDLIARGHRFVADDLVLIEKDVAEGLIGFSPELSRHYMEVRGLGLLNIHDLYGGVAVRDRKKIDMVLELVPLDAKEKTDRLGLEVMEEKILGVSVPRVKVPSWEGRNITTIIEVAARNQILRWSGKDSALEFEKRHREKLCEP